MAGGDVIEMSLREIRRLRVIRDVTDGRITVSHASGQIGLSERQVRRLSKAVRERGEIGIIHGLRGKTSNRRIDSETKERVLVLCRTKYMGFGPTLASEKLRESDEIRVSSETLRTWLKEAGLWQRARRRSSHRRWRERRECFGEMVQVDGSHHDWLESRGPKMVLMGYIDDATNNVFARFYEYEGTIPAMDSFKRYTRMYGLPVSIYLDRHSTYKSSKKPSEWEELEGTEALSHFERALSELGVEVIHAHSPQAKGRVERLFKTLQDRLIKEMRLKDVRTMDDANRFIEIYLPLINRKFAVLPANETDAHVKLPDRYDLDKHLCIKSKRVMRKDNTIAYDRKLFQIEGRVAAKKVTVEERTDGSMRITCDGVALRYTEIREMPKKQETMPINPKKLIDSVISSKNNFWQKGNESIFVEKRASV